MKSILYCDGFEIYLDDESDYYGHIESLKQKINIRLIDGEITENENCYECINCKSSLSQYSVETHFKEKEHI